MNTMRKFHWFWPWNDEKEEEWLREMSGQGWHFKTVEPPGFYVFERGEPIDYVYRLDYLTGRDDMENYQQLFEDAGWDYLGEMGGWQYFRQEVAQGKLQEIYTDNASKVKKYQRMMVFLIILVPVLISAMLLFGIGGIPEIMVFLTTIILLTVAYALLRLMQRISQLRAKNGSGFSV